ncbi:penicillin-binding protein 2 [Patescibacteria group bacterium]|nr:penicillin-binding protein 2 [Patescibacteria group bacterium]
MQSPTRIILLMIVFFGITVGLVARLFSVSVLRHQQYVAEASQQQEVTRDVLPKRGDIYVQDAAAGKNQVIAESVERFALSATPHNIDSKHRADFANLLSQYSGVDAQKILDTFNQDSMYMNPLKHGLTKGDVEAVAAAINKLERSYNPAYQDAAVNFDDSQGNILYFVGGIFFIREFSRIYPEGGLLGQTLGFVNDNGAGQYGLEGEYNSELTGYPGKLSIEQDSTGNLLAETQLVKGQDGTSYELSIDRNVQYVMEQDLADEVKSAGATGGSIVIMDPKTGEIIAMASTPSYDPNSFRDITPDQIGLFDNPVISKQWEPGSIFKPFVMSAALDLGLVTPDTSDNYPESVTVDGYKIETALRHAYGEETMTKVIVNSDNVAMVSVANKLGNQNMYGYLKKYGFGDLTGIDLKNEITGTVLPVSQWSDISRATMSFGQGIAVTPMQVIAAYAAIANNGKLVQPRLVKTVIKPDGSRQTVPMVEGQQVIKPQTAQEIRDMMLATVEQADRKAEVPGYKIGGKTGTAQIPDPQNGGYLKDAYNHSFVGIEPIDNPRFVVLVKIDHPDLQKSGLFAESDAVPLFSKVSQFLLNYYQVPPTNPSN